MGHSFHGLPVCDYCNYDSSGVVLHVGGNYSQNTNHGLFYLNGNNTASNANTNIGCRFFVHMVMVFARLYAELLNTESLLHTSW